ncbi:MAG: ABC transporter substrate-binding protein, partial [Dehalococcoidia bacterium]|nr:ABC transporter substrate-binding protein [Dehalococcoidia bacterium]
MRFRPIGLILLVLMVVPMLLSCTAATTTPSTSEVSTKPYGTLNIAVNFRGGTLDPAINTPNVLQTLSLGIFDSLVELTPDAKPRPGIAERWEISADGKAHTFFIRKGVKFHDGTDLTGADVKFSLDRILAPEATHQDAASWRPIVAGVDLKDEYTVVMNLKTPLFELLPGFTNFAGNNAIVPKKYIETKGVEYFRANPIGSGPWKVVKYIPGARLELEANEAHWRVVPKFKNLNILSGPEEGTKVAML